MKAVSSQWSVVSKSAFSFALGSLLFALCASAQAQQQAKKGGRVGFLSVTFASAISDRVEAFRQGLRELGYVEGKNIIVEWRYAQDNLDRPWELAAELVRLKVDVIVTAGPQATRSAMEATATIPVVMAQDNDPIGSGVVASLARPGGNVTGLSLLAPEISGKQLELLKEIVPKVSRVAVLANSSRPGTAQELREMEVAASTLGVRLHILSVLSAKDIETAFRSARNGRDEAVVELTNAILLSQRTKVLELAINSRLPVISNSSTFVEAGGLMSYGASLADNYRRAATYVDKILKGARPADLPVEQPKKFEFIINLKTAKQIGLTIPPNVLARADRVIR
jgi:ABC-type uncharacterized transport system substrate-binding protein